MRLAWELELGNTREYPRYSELDQFRKKSSCFAYCVNHFANVPTLRNEPSLVPMFHVFKANPSQRFDFIKKQKHYLKCFSAKHSVKD